ncbi:hypothetical protein JCM7686_3378 [Paracoccus aminophilus JCM 7686]|uniref:Uncharacterized protein n=2 Tax=Paracoccus aminophilus TaxID=34003 RepID=S5YG27_PARAH|nr:hypothetical protein JCM7686_3378 [Paracoccus aminophilus JCM 7686]
MRYQFAPFLLTFGLACCAAAEEAPVTGGGSGASSGEVIRIFQGGGFSGSTEKRLTPDDRLVITKIRPHKSQSVATLHLRPGAYDAALRYLRAHPIAKEKLASTSICLDYGSDEISGGGMFYKAVCPKDEMTALSDALEQIISDHQ